jgi:multidrug efflux pump subunit AcrA (membrane-fusion protein)
MDTLVAREREFIAREEASLDFQEALLDAQQRAIDEQKAIIQARRRSLEDEISLAELQRRLVPETPRKRRRVTSDHMTHEEVCASVGLGPTQRGITLIPDGVYMQCQTENDVGYEDYITDDYGL